MKENTRLLEEIWERLHGVSRVRLLAKSNTQHSAWNRKGEGLVALKSEGNSLIFTETGQWEETTYTNAIRWTLDLMNGLIGVEHLRFGIQHPVFLFHLTARDFNTLKSLEPHLCGEDTYVGHLKLYDLYIQFKIRAIGP